MIFSPFHAPAVTNATARAPSRSAHHAGCRGRATFWCVTTGPGSDCAGAPCACTVRDVAAGAIAIVVDAAEADDGTAAIACSGAAVSADAADPGAAAAAAGTGVCNCSRDVAAGAIGAGAAASALPLAAATAPGALPAMVCWNHVATRPTTLVDLAPPVWTGFT